MTAVWFSPHVTWLTFLFWKCSTALGSWDSQTRVPCPSCPNWPSPNVYKSSAGKAKGLEWRYTTESKWGALVWADSTRTGKVPTEHYPILSHITLDFLPHFLKNKQPTSISCPPRAWKLMITVNSILHRWVEWKTPCGLVILKGHDGNRCHQSQ